VCFICVKHLMNVHCAFDNDRILQMLPTYK